MLYIIIRIRIVVCIAFNYDMNYELDGAHSRCILNRSYWMRGTKALRGT